MSKFYVLVSNQFSGIYFDEENFHKAKGSNHCFAECCFIDLNEAKSFLYNNLSAEIKKFYVIKNGRIKGIMLSWDDCKTVTNGYAGAKYKGFTQFDAAVEYFTGNSSFSISEKSVLHSETPLKPYAYVDGSFNSKSKIYGYGVVLITSDGHHYEFFGANNDKDLALMRNVAGEIEGAMRAVSEAINLNLNSITIFYDYEGIERWANGDWKCNKNGTVNYQKFINESRNKIKIDFVKVKAHTGVELNEKVDKLAKQAVGLI